jgi:hypothetical protein
MLTTNLITGYQWKNLRINQKEKWKNSHWFEVFNKKLLSFSDDFNGVVSYYDGSSITKKPSTKLIEYSENTPIFYHFKLSPNGYFLYNYKPDPLWQAHDIDTNILSFYNKQTNKYKQPDNKFNFQYPYILFALQSLPARTDIKKLIEVILWAEKNKTYLLFKKHPFSKPNDVFDKLFTAMRSKKLITKYAILVSYDFNIDYLISACEGLWTFSSGTGFQALLKNKPVSVFKVQSFCADYYPIARLCSSPEEAYNNKSISEDTVKRFFSWYYNKLVIDLSTKDCEEKIYNRLHDVYIKRKSIEEIF